MADNSDGRYERVKEPDDPRRCQSNTSKGQCLLVSIQGSQYCHLHGGYAATEKQKKEDARIYHLTKWRARLERHVDNPGIKSLREEIGILRMILESRLELIQSELDLVVQSSSINETIRSIERLVVSCHRIEDKMGELIDKSALTHIAGRVISVIAQVFHDQPEKLEQVVNSIEQIIKAGALAASEEEVDLSE